MAVTKFKSLWCAYLTINSRLLVGDLKGSATTPMIKQCFAIRKRAPNRKRKFLNVPFPTTTEVAQWSERSPHSRDVAGSNPLPRHTKNVQTIVLIISQH